ncbi:MAG TPA: hypothetical protein DDW96_06405 [Synergistaceae bacterium]|nr:MAG: Uncharacterized protein XD83_0712 [Synergistales bacterium 57_84]KUK87112.1 MAG: Uncharacterized protein XE01_0814 [Synergistales bacterium 58_81]HBG14934.1 hypothetical protein [Synergistaceae bacterium]HCP06907.1 hypothetical protein [Synergistaceae bacterium]
MQEEPRRVFVTLGKKSYPILTRLDERRFERVLQIAKESVSGVDPSMEQDERLLLACFKLAFSIESAESKIRDLLGGCGSI